MSQNIKELFGAKLAARDGDIGHIKDFYFDDKTWVVRYVVAETGSWFTGRKVLLSPYAFGSFNQDGPLAVNLTREQIENSPPIESHEPVSRQYEVKYYHYYGWPAYWEGPRTWGIWSYPVVLPLAKPEVGAEAHEPGQGDSHLRSMRAVEGYQVKTSDGTIGHLYGFTVDRESWAIRGAVVKTGRHSDDEILISPDQIDEISFAERKMIVNLTKGDFSRSGGDEVARAGGGDLRATNFHD